MSDIDPVTSLAATGSVTSRFVSSNELDEAKKRREEEWKAAYARIGQDPPPPPPEAEYDPRPLHERLQAQKAMKQEEWDEKMKMSNQYKWLEEEDVHFLDDVAKKKNQEYRLVQQREQEELARFKALQKAGPAAPPAPTVAASSSSSSSRPPPPSKAPAKKTAKELMKGLVKKKPISKPSTESVSGVEASSETSKTPDVVAAPIKGTNEPSKPKPEEPKKRALLLGDYSDSDASDDEPDSKRTKT